MIRFRGVRRLLERRGFHFVREEAENGTLYTLMKKNGWTLAIPHQSYSKSQMRTLMATVEKMEAAPPSKESVMSQPAQPEPQRIVRKKYDQATRVKVWTRIRVLHEHGMDYTQIALKLREEEIRLPNGDQMLASYVRNALVTMGLIQAGPSVPTAALMAGQRASQLPAPAPAPEKKGGIDQEDLEEVLRILQDERRSDAAKVKMVRAYLAYCTAGDE